MEQTQPRPIWLDYRNAAADAELLTNLSAVAVAGDFLWTASDEGRTIECLEPGEEGYRLRCQYPLDSLFPDLPGSKSGDEADIESLDVCDGQLWICGAHCKVRKQTKNPEHLNPHLKGRPSRHLVGRVELTDGGGALGEAEALPFSGKGSLRRMLGQDEFLGPFVGLPSKENGLEIEGFAIGNQGNAFLGLRGPLIDSFAVVVEIALEEGLRLRPRKTVMHFLNLEGLGVRDLARWEDDILLLAGPVSSAPGPFRVHRWRPHRTPLVQSAPTMKIDLPRTERPEGISRLVFDGKSGLLVLYDLPQSRIEGSRYRADWFCVGEE